MTRTGSLRPLWLTENYPPDGGGMAESCDRIAGALRGRGVAIDLVHFSRRYPEWRVETKTGGRQICCPLDDDPAHTVNRLWSLIARDAAAAGWTHVVAFGGTLPLIAGPVFSAWLGRPLVTLIRGNDFDTGIFSLRKGDILRQALRSAARVCTVSRDHARKIEMLEPRVHPEWIPNGIDLGSWKLLPQDRERGARWRQENVPAGRRVLGMFGQLKQKKGGSWFLDLLRLSGHTGRFHLLLVGEAEKEILDLLETHRGAISASVLPFRDRYELLPLYAACDLIVIPSFYDGLPNVVLEAAGLGIPLLASAAGGMPDVLTDGENAILFPAGDESGCRRAIGLAATLTDLELRLLGERCQNVVARDFSVEREVARYCDVLDGTETTTALAIARDFEGRRQIEE